MSAPPQWISRPTSGGEHEAYDPTRINAILSKQRKRAEELGLDEDQAELIWKTLIDWNVNYEKGIIVARRGTKHPS